MNFVVKKSGETKTVSGSYLAKYLENGWELAETLDDDGTVISEYHTEDLRGMAKEIIDNLPAEVITGIPQSRLDEMVSVFPLQFHVHEKNPLFAKAKKDLANLVVANILHEIKLRGEIGLEADVAAKCRKHMAAFAAQQRLHMETDGKCTLPCPRCGKRRMHENVFTNALSRHADIYICPQCGMNEAIWDMQDMVLPAKDWWCNEPVVKMAPSGPVNFDADHTPYIEEYNLHPSNFLAYAKAMEYPDAVIMSQECSDLVTEWVNNNKIEVFEALKLGVYGRVDANGSVSMKNPGERVYSFSETGKEEVAFPSAKDMETLLYWKTEN